MTQTVRGCKTRRDLLIGAGATALFGAACPAAADDDKDIAAAEARLSKSFHGVVRAMRNGQTIHERAYGFSDIAAATPNRTDLRFRIGSVSKTFTAALTTGLARHGALSLDDPVDRYVPGIAGGSRIRIIDLIEHRSGLEDFSQREWKRILINTPRPSREDMLGLLVSRRQRRPPGGAFVYNNAGYVLLGLIVEAATGSTYPEALRLRLLEPQALPDTGFAPRDADILGLATGHGPNGKVDRQDYDYTAIAAAGGLYSTVAGLSRWCGAHDDPEAPGWRRGVRYGHRAIWHSGNVNDYSALIARFPEIDGTYVVLSNVGQRPPPKALMRTLPERLFRS